MPLMIHPTSGQLLLAPSGQLAVSAECCCAVTCAQLQACMDVVGSAVGRDVQITIAGVADDECTSCDPFFNDAFIIDGADALYETAGAGCHILGDTGTILTCPAFLGITWVITYSIEIASLDPFLWSLNVFVKYSDGLSLFIGKSWSLGDSVTSFAALREFCSGQIMDLTPVAGTGDYCDFSSATCTIQRL